MEHLQQRGPQDGLLQRRDAVESPALGVLRDLLVELGRVVGGRVRERARERRGVPVEDVVERPAGQVVLVEGEDGGAALLGTFHARDMYEPERVSTLILSPMFTNSGRATVAPVSSVAGLLPPPEAVSPFTPGSVCVTSSSTDAASWMSDGSSSMNSRSTVSLGLTHFSVSATLGSGIAICSYEPSSMKCASVPSE